MNAKAEQVGGSSAADIAKFTLAVLVLLGGFVGYYWFNDLASWQRLLILLGSFLLGGAVGYFTRSGHALRDFFSESLFELRKVVWPTRDEALKLTGVVLMVVMIISLVLALFDLIISQLVKLLLGH